MKKFTNLAQAVNYLIGIGQQLTDKDIENIGLEIELRGEIIFAVELLSIIDKSK